MKTLFIRNLPPDTTEQAFVELFSQFGTVRSSKLVLDVFSGQCKGFGTIDMEGHEARAAIANLDGRDYNGRPLKVNFEVVKKGRRRR